MKRDVQVSRVHQLAHNVVQRGVELLQVFGAVGALGNAVQRGAEGLGSFLLGDVAVKNIDGELYPIHHDWSGGYADIDQRSVFAAALGIERDSLSLGQCLMDPAGFSATVWGNNQRVNWLSKRLFRRVSEDTREFGIDTHDPVWRVENTDCLGGTLHQLLEVGSLHLGIKVCPIYGLSGLQFGRGGAVGDERGDGAAMQRLAQHFCASYFRLICRPGDFVTHRSPSMNARACLDSNSRGRLLESYGSNFCRMKKTKVVAPCGELPHHVALTESCSHGASAFRRDCRLATPDF